MRFLELAKPRIALMVALTTFLGYWFAGGGASARLAWALLGTLLAACASGALNQVLEAEQDGLMRRTRGRPLPSGRLSPGPALAFGLACAALGLGILAYRVNALTAGLAAFTVGTYVCAYTPLKRLTPQSTWIGAMAGATSPLIGWAAARGQLAPEAWALFSIQFLWQIPHFLAMFWLHREDYARAGFRVMPVADPSGAATAFQIALHSFALLLASLVPAVLGMAKLPYGFGALAVSSAFLVLGLRCSWTLDPADARTLFRASLAYLPAIFLMLGLATPPVAASIEAPALSAELTDSFGRRVRLADIPRPWVGAFIYTRCTGQCPMVTTRMRGLARRLPGARLVSMSLDPTDTPADLSAYARDYGAGWLLLTGKPGEVRDLSLREFHLPAAEGRGEGEPIIHSRKLFLVGREGRVEGYFDSDDEAQLSELARRLQES